MYNIEKVTDRFSSVVGYSQVTDPDLTPYSEDIISTDSSLVIQNFHPLLQDETIEQIIPNFKGYNFDEWSSTASYIEGDIIKFGSNFYVALLDNIGLNPVDNTNEWEIKDYKSDYLSQVNRDADTRLLNSVLLNNAMGNHTKSLLDTISVFTGSGRMIDRNTPQSRFVGLTITPRRQKGISINITSLGLQFTAIQTDLPIYVYHSSSLEPIYTTTVSTNSANTFQWVDFDFNFSYDSLDYDSGGVFYIGYYEDDIQGQSIKKYHDFSRVPSYCSSCNNRDLMSFKEYNRHFTIKPFNVSNSELDGTNLWDIEKTRYENSNNYGLNFKFSAHCDITEVILQNADIWANAIATQRAVLLLEKIAFNVRDNGLSEKTKNLALMELKGKPEAGITGLYSVLKGEIKRLNFDLSDLNSVCFPKKIKGARRTTI